MHAVIGENWRHLKHTVQIFTNIAGCECHTCSYIRAFQGSESDLLPWDGLPAPAPTPFYHSLSLLWKLFSIPANSSREELKTKDESNARIFQTTPSLAYSPLFTWEEQQKGGRRGGRTVGGIAWVYRGLRKGTFPPSGMTSKDCLLVKAFLSCSCR